MQIIFNGNKLRIKRVLKELTQKELAKKINVAPITIFRYEKRGRIPDGETLMKLTQVFECETSEFFE